MYIEYEKDYLEELYNDGKCKNKKYRFQKAVVTKYQKRIDTLMAATRIEDLFVFNSLNFEALENGYYSIRIDYHSLSARIQNQRRGYGESHHDLHSYRHYEPLSIKGGKTMNRITTHPGEVLKEELEARGMSQKKFSELLNVPYTQLNEILNGKRPVTTDFALMMEAALGINPELLINMQSRYNMSVARQKKSLIAKLLDIKRACAAIF